MIAAKIYSYLLLIFSGLGLVFLVAKKIESGLLLGSIAVVEIVILVILVFQLYVAFELSKFKKSGVIGGVIVASIWFVYAGYFASVNRSSSMFWGPPVEEIFIFPALLLLALSLYVLASFLGKKKIK